MAYFKLIALFALKVIYTDTDFNCSDLYITSFNDDLNQQAKTSTYTYNEVKRNFLYFYCISEK